MVREGPSIAGDAAPSFLLDFWRDDVDCTGDKFSSTLRFLRFSESLAFLEDNSSDSTEVTSSSVSLPSLTAMSREKVIIFLFLRIDMGGVRVALLAILLFAC